MKITVLTIFMVCIFRQTKSYTVSIDRIQEDNDNLESHQQWNDDAGTKVLEIKLKENLDNAKVYYKYTPESDNDDSLFENSAMLCDTDASDYGDFAASVLRTLLQGQNDANCPIQRGSYQVPWDFKVDVGNLNGLFDDAKEGTLVLHFKVPGVVEGDVFIFPS